MPPIYAIADRLAPALRRQFLAAFALIQSRVSLVELTAAIASGNLPAIVAALQIAKLSAALLPAVAVVEAIVIQAAAQTLTEIAVRASFMIVNPLAAAAAQTVGQSLVAVVTKETLAGIRALVGRAVTEGIAPRELATLITPAIGLNARQAQALVNARTAWADAGLSGPALDTKAAAYATQLLKQRAVTIARTSTIEAANRGQLAAWQGAVQAGLLDPAQTSRIWSAASDARVCERCAALDEQTVEFDEPFDDDGDEVMAPPLHPNCRCSVSLVVERARRAA